MRCYKGRNEKYGTVASRKKNDRDPYYFFYTFFFKFLLENLNVSFSNFPRNPCFKNRTLFKMSKAVNQTIIINRLSNDSRDISLYLCIFCLSLLWLITCTLFHTAITMIHEHTLCVCFVKVVVDILCMIIYCIVVQL